MAGKLASWNVKLSDGTGIYSVVAKSGYSAYRQVVKLLAGQGRPNVRPVSFTRYGS